MAMLIDKHACNLKEKHAFMSDMKLGAKSTWVQERLFIYELQ